MSNSIHGHALLHQLSDHGPMPRTAFVAWAHAQFGPEALYHACFAEGLSLEPMIEALKQRGKISEGPEGLSFGDGAEICNH